MNLDDKHFYVFCYTQSINPTEKSWDLYEAFFKPQYKYIDEIYNDIKAVLDFDLEAHLLKLYPTLIKGTYNINENGTNITFNYRTPYTTNIDYDPKLYKLSWKHKNGLTDNESIVPDLMFKNPFLIFDVIKNRMHDLKQYVGSIVRKNPLTYKQLFQLPVFSSTKTIGYEIYKEFDFQNVISFEIETTEVKDFERKLVFTDTTCRDTLEVEICTYKDRPLLVSSTHSNPDLKQFNLQSILDEDLYKQFKDHVHSLCNTYYEDNLHIFEIDSEFNLIHTSLKGKCF